MRTGSTSSCRYTAGAASASPPTRSDSHAASRASAWPIRTRARNSARFLPGRPERTGGGDMSVYGQVPRGAQYGRPHAPLPDTPRTVFAFCAPLPVPPAEALERGVACVTASDSRWARCDIKSTSLLANVLLRQLSVDAAAAETILLRDGELTEASASAVHVVLGGGLLMPPHSRPLLPRTTHRAVEEPA